MMKDDTHVTAEQDGQASNSDAGAEYCRSLLEMLDGPAAIVSNAGDFVFVNSALEALLVTHRSKLLGQPIADVVPVSDEFVQSLSYGNPFHVELPSGQKDTPSTLEMTPVLGSDEDISGWVARIHENLVGSENSGAFRESLDTLTNLPDKVFIKARLDALISSNGAPNSSVTVMCVDLDGFDRVNRDYGRAAGDKILIETAKRLGRSMRATNVVGRLVEDSFLVIIPDMRSEEQITSVATRIISNLSKPFIIKGVREPIILTSSVGIAENREGETNASELISQAQAAVDLAKKTGKGTFQFFTNTTGGEIRERRSRISNLRRAIDQGQFDLVYQPKMSLVTNKIVGAEALVRWYHPESGTIMPDEFIPLAEDAGLIDPLGNQILTTACEVLRGWCDQKLDFMRIAVNVSAREVARKSFYDDLVATISSTKVPPEMLELELTESAIMEGAEDIIRSLHKIRELGVHLTADDFGTGYASLSYLKDFPLDGLKIDTTFVADIENPEEGGALAAAVIAVGHSMGMNVVAEGVETQHQLNYLRWRQCDQAQGFLISEPLEAAAFEALVRKEIVD